MSQLRGHEAASSEPRWPRALGTLGIIVAVLMFIDQIDDLVFLPVLSSSGWWARIVGPELGERIVRWLPPPAWLAASALVGLGLAVLLFAASTRLRRRLRSGASLTRTWAWLAIAWLAVEIVQTSVWLTRHADEVGGVSSASWMSYSVLGIIGTFAILLAYPVFLLIWLARAPIQTAVAHWPD